MKTFKLLAVATLMSSTATMPAFAYEKGDLIIRSGFATIVPNEKSEVLSLDGVGDVGNLLGTTTGLTTDNSSQPAFSFTYMLSETWGLNTIIAPPPEHNVYAEGLEPLGVSKLGTYKHVPATLVLQYFIPTGTRFEPYLGLGVNYTHFFDEQTVNSLDTNLYASDTELKIDPAFGWVAQAGVDYRINANWLISAAAYYIDLETNAELQITDTALLGGDATLKTSADLNPMVYFVSIGYQF
jgi:outer membrane protein